MELVYILTMRHPNEEEVIWGVYSSSELAMSKLSMKWEDLGSGVWSTEDKGQHEFWMIQEWKINDE